jgi:translation initiation factor 2 alpha subunit (eIF-2alpha)
MARAKQVSARTLAQQERCLQLFVGGASYELIAQTVGYANRSGAKKAVDAALERHKAEREELADEARLLVLERYDALWRGLFVKAAKGDAAAARSCVRILEAVTKLQGLDAPTKVETSVTVQSEQDVEIRALLAAMNAAESAGVDVNG